MLFIGPDLLGHITWVGLTSVEVCQRDEDINRVMIE